MRDHLDDSPSETVRRHAATFRKVREARRASSGEVLSDEDRVDGPMEPMREVASDELPSAAARIAAKATAAGWAVRATYSRAADGAEGVAVRARRPGEAVVGYWRCPTPRPPMKSRWGFVWALRATPSDGLVKIGSRELADVVVSDGHAL